MLKPRFLKLMTIPIFFLTLAKWLILQHSLHPLCKCQGSGGGWDFIHWALKNKIIYFYFRNLDWLTHANTTAQGGLQDFLKPSKTMIFKNQHGSRTKVLTILKRKIWNQRHEKYCVTKIKNICISLKHKKLFALCGKRETKIETEKYSMK